MTWFKENWFKILILIVVAATASAYLYLNELKPAQDKRECYERAEMWRENAITAENNMDQRGLLTKRSDYEKVFADNYKTCLLQKGL